MVTPGSLGARPSGSYMERATLDKLEFHVTGDLGAVDMAGEVWYAGRVSDAVEIAGGVAVLGAVAIEAVLNSHKAVDRSAVVHCGDSAELKNAVAVLQLRPDIRGGIDGKLR